MKHGHFIVPPGTKIRLKDYDPGFTGAYKTKEEASAKLRKDINRLAISQDVLYAQNTYALLVILQAMDTAGKDGTIRHEGMTILKGIKASLEALVQVLRIGLLHTEGRLPPLRTVLVTPCDSGLIFMARMNMRILVISLK